MSLFKESLKDILGVEGKFSDHPSDSGGETMCGITKAVAREFGWQGKMQDLPDHLIEQIYRERYWNVLKLSNVEAILPEVVQELFDTGINQGTGRAAEYLQRSLNALNRQERDFADIAVDGSIGPATLGALQAYKDKRGMEGAVVLLRALNCLQGEFYMTLSQKRKKDEDFVYGWLLNRVFV